MSEKTRASPCFSLEDKFLEKIREGGGGQADLPSHLKVNPIHDVVEAKRLLYQLFSCNFYKRRN